MAILGLRDTTGFTTDLRPKNWREGLTLLYRYGATTKAALFSLTSMMKTRVVDDPEHYWWTKEPSTRRFRLDVDEDLAADAGDTAIIFEDSTHADYRDARELKMGDVLRLEHSGELVQVMSDPVDDRNIIVRRSVGAVAATALDADGSGINPFAVVVGSAYEEGSNAPTGVARDPEKLYNQTQIHRQSLEFTGTAINTRLRSKADVNEAKREALEFFSCGVERSLWLGENTTFTKNGKPMRTSGGLLSFMPAANVVDESGGSTTYADFEEYMQRAFKYGPDEKMAFIGDRALLTIQRIVRLNSVMNISPVTREFGMAVKKLETPFGILTLKRAPLFSDLSSGTNTTAFWGMDSWLWVVDMDSLQYVHMKNRDVKYLTKQQENGLDGEKSGYLGEISLECLNPKAHFLIKGLQDAAADS